MSGFVSGLLGDLIELKRGYDLPRQSRIAGKVPIVSSSGISDYHDVPMVKSPGVVTGRYGTLGQVFYLAEDFWPLNTSLYVRDFKGNDPRFISYFLRSLDFYAYSDKAAVPGLNRNDLHVAPIVYPKGIEQQRQIAGLLGAIDDKIELNRRMNETLEAVARAIFKDWFIDFGPTRAKAEGRAPYLAPEIWRLFPNRLDEDGKPKAWQNGRLSEVLELAYGKSLPSRDRINGPVPVYGSGGISGWHNTSLVNGQTIIVGRKGTVGSIYWESRPSFPIDTVFYVRSSHPMTYCLHLLESLGLETMNTDAAVPGLNRENAYRLDVTIDNSAILAFDALVSPMRNRMDANLCENETLVATRDLLLSKLMSGEIRIRDAEAMIAAAA